jgi:hypothetical protein
MLSKNPSIDTFPDSPTSVRTLLANNGQNAIIRKFDLKPKYNVGDTGLDFKSPVYEFSSPLKQDIKAKVDKMKNYVFTFFDTDPAQKKEDKEKQVIKKQKQNQRQAP